MKDRSSRTAFKVARDLLLLTSDSDRAPFVPSAAAEWTERLLDAAGLIRPWDRFVFARPWLQRCLYELEHRAVPGQDLYIALRKRFMEDETRAAIRCGLSQVLVVGVGFDSLAPRLSVEFPDVVFLEVDHPATEHARSRALEGLGFRQANHRLVAADLDDVALPSAVGRWNRWQTDAPSVVVSEGLMMYLDEARVATLLSEFHSVAGANSRLLFSWIAADEHGRIQVHGPLLTFITLRVLSWIGERFLWGSRRKDLGHFLECSGWILDGDDLRTDLRRRYLEPAGRTDLPFRPVEFVGAASRDDRWRFRGARLL